jgi:signal transduction histidine kinase/CheY-like chemotaxis protein
MTTDAAGRRLSGAPNLDRIRAEQTRTLYRNCPLGVVSAAGVSIMVAVAVSSRSGGSAAALWSLSIVGCAVAHLAVCALYWRADPPVASWRRWIGLFTLLAFVEGIAWGLGVALLASPDDYARTIFLLVAWAGLGAGGIVVFGSYPLTYVLFLYPAIGPHIYFALTYRYPFHQPLTALLAVFLVAMPLIAWRFSQQLIAGLRLQFANLDLAEDLRVQKEAAEQANLAKSQFLAAISHDLRQPVHALGLFVSTLRGRQMDEGAARLVDMIDSSVAAMGELFTSLLDISKLDAGAVQPRFESVAVGPLLERLCREYVDEAQAKGIELRCRRRALNVHSDSVLIERSVRNLISNAVRYTDAGGVLVGCRCRGGSGSDSGSGEVSIEVWDTGCGIPPQQHERIFQEFYQVGNPERDRTKGVGLGLAIVRRTASLIGAELFFRSEPGRGSMFRLTMPRAADGPAPADASEAAAPPPPHDRQILVIDDDLAIQQAMQGLLASWGHRVAVAGSGQEAARLLADQPMRPDLIICDYRLRGDETGVAVIQQLHRQFDASIPAILITGDTAPARIAEAQASGFALLHKPLSNSKLRAAIGNLLRRKIPAGPPG